MVAFSADVCADAKKVDNLTGFVYHPTDCDKFIQCHFYDNNTVAVYRTCPLGQYWNHAFLRCDEACDVDCPYGEILLDPGRPVNCTTSHQDGEKETDRQTDRQTETETDRERQREREENFVLFPRVLDQKEYIYFFTLSPCPNYSRYNYICLYIHKFCSNL